NSMQNLHQQARVSPPRQRQPMIPLLTLAEVVDPFLEKAEIKVEEGGERSTVRLSSATGLKATEIVNSLSPSMTAARSAARRTQSINNLKQIGLAFHNYQSANNRLPASAGVAPNSKYPHSWRVAILPYIDQQPLYNKYH